MPAAEKRKIPRVPRGLALSETQRDALLGFCDGDKTKFCEGAPAIARRTAYRLFDCTSVDNSTYKTVAEQCAMLDEKGEPSVQRLLTWLDRGAPKSNSPSDSEQTSLQSSADTVSNPKRPTSYLDLVSQKLGFKQTNDSHTLDWLFVNCSFGLSLVELFGTYEEMNRCLAHLTQRLTEHPGDIFLRALVGWAILRRGTPDKVIAMATETATFLKHRSTSSVINWNDWEQALYKIKHGEITEPSFARRHLEDALMRAALLDWLNLDGNDSALARRICCIATSQDLPLVVKLLFEAKDGHNEHEWTTSVIDKVSTLLDRQHTSGLGCVLLLWLTGRRGDHKNIPSVVERACRWVEVRPGINDSLVRWGTIWLSGMADYQVDRVLQQTRAWLLTAASEDDRLVRMSYFWLAGAKGTPRHVEVAVDDGATWLATPPLHNDSCTRVAYLVWLMRRAYESGVVSAQQLQVAFAETRRWLNGNNNQIVRLGLNLAESIL